MKRCVQSFFVIISLSLLIACSEPMLASETLPVTPTAAILATPLESTLPVTGTPIASNGWITYTHPDDSFLIDYPADFEITPAEDNSWLNLGNQIQISITSVNPIECQGPCPVIDTTESTNIAGYETTKVTGYIGSIGGNNPQHYLSYIFFHNDLFYTFSLFSLTFDTPLINPPPSTIEPLDESDIRLFEQILGTLRFRN